MLVENDDPKKLLTKLEEVVLCLQKQKEDGFYGKIIETYENGKKVHTKIEITVK